tara:strand:- start:2754 stop:3800 length:1047 start_codon:yes stop_codon:yes gene_type:complete
MKKWSVFGVSIILVFFLSSLASSIRINEVELNPESSDSGKEWIELYSESEINLSGWKIMKGNNDFIEIEGIFTNYYLIELQTRWLNNEDEQVFLYNNSTLEDESIIFSDTSNDNRTWQNCDNGWEFLDFTKEQENSCGNDNEDNQDTDEPEIYIELDYDNSVRHGETFKVKVKGFNLLDKKYDVKVFVEDEDENIISEIYNKEDEKWESGNYYINEVFSDSGNETESLKLKIKDGDFLGDGKIIARIRVNGEGDFVDEIEDDIEIKEKKEEVVDEIIEDNNLITGQVIEEPVIETRSVIRLNEGIDINITENQKIYKSKTQYIKDYAIYAFTLFCIIIIIALIFKDKI